jgi:hypothetical protein
MKTLGYIIVLIVVSILSTLWNGYVLSALWRWFIVPAFSAPALSLGFAIGVALVVNYLTNHTKIDAESDKSWGKLLLDGALLGAIKPALALLFGWIVTLFL